MVCLYGELFLIFLSHFPVTLCWQRLVCVHCAQHSGWDIMCTNKDLEKEVERRKGKKGREGGREKEAGKKSWEKWRRCFGREQTGPSRGGWVPSTSPQTYRPRFSLCILAHPGPSTWLSSHLRSCACSALSVFNRHFEVPPPHLKQPSPPSLPPEYPPGLSHPWHPCPHCHEHMSPYNLERPPMPRDVQVACIDIAIK